MPKVYADYPSGLNHGGLLRFAELDRSFLRFLEVLRGAWGVLLAWALRLPAVRHDQPGR